MNDSVENTASDLTELDSEEAEGFEEDEVTGAEEQEDEEEEEDVEDEEEEEQSIHQSGRTRSRVGHSTVRSNR